MNAKTLVKKLSWIDRVLQQVWLVLGILMIASTFLLQQAGYTYLAWLVVVVILATACYPIYTFGYKLYPSLIGNIIYTALVLYVCITVYQVLPIASFLLIPIIPWVVVATVYVGARIMLGKKKEISM